MYNVLIVDDQKSSRELMRYIVQSDENFQVAHTLHYAEDAKPYCKNNLIDLILMDICTGSDETGIIAAETIKQTYPNIKIIIVTFLILQEHIEKARKIGCDGFWYKDHSEQKLIEVMNSVMRGEKVYPDKQPNINIGLAKTSDFTKQELHVLQLKVNGYSHHETCKKLGITRSTLNYHINNLKIKTGYDNLLKLAIDVSMKKFIISEESSENF